MPSPTLSSPTARPDYMPDHLAVQKLVSDASFAASVPLLRQGRAGEGDPALLYGQSG